MSSSEWEQISRPNRSPVWACELISDPAAEIGEKLAGCAS